MELSEVQEYLTTNKDSEGVKTYLDSFKVQPSLEVFKNKLNDSDFKSFMDSEKDKHLTKGIETFKTNNLDRIYTERYLEEHPETDEKEIARNKRISDLETESANNKKDATRERLTNKALRMLHEKGLHDCDDFVDEFFIGIDETTTMEKITKFESMIKPQVDSQVNERMKGSSYTPPKGTGNSGGKNPFAKETFNLTEQGKMFKENPELAKTLMAASNK